MTWAIKKKSYSRRRAYTLVSLAPKTYRYRSKQADDTGLGSRLKELG